MDSNKDKPSFLSPTQGVLLRGRSSSVGSFSDGQQLARTRSGSMLDNSPSSLSLLGRERSNSLLRRALDDNRREPIWWRPLTIEGIEGITIQVDTVIKQFQEIHLSKDPEVSRIVADFIRSIEQQITKLSQFYRENRGDERAILFELQSLKLRQLFRGWQSHSSHVCAFSDVELQVSSPATVLDKTNGIESDGMNSALTTPMVKITDTKRSNRSISKKASGKMYKPVVKSNTKKPLIVVTEEELPRSPKQPKKKVVKPKPEPKNFIKQNRNAFKPAPETQSIIDIITNPIVDSPKTAKPLYYWEMQEYWRKSPPKMTSSSSNLQEKLAELDLDSILADFHVLISKQEVQELLERKDELIKKGYLTNAQAQGFLQKNAGRLSYSTNGTSNSFFSEQSSTPFIDDSIRTHIAERDTSKTNWVAPKDFFVPQNFRLGETPLAQKTPEEASDPMEYTVRHFGNAEEILNKRYPYMELSLN